MSKIKIVLLALGLSIAGLNAAPDLEVVASPDATFRE